MIRGSQHQIARVGFQVSDARVSDITGYCAAEMAITAANEAKRLPFALELVPIVDQRNADHARHEAEKFAADPRAIGVLGPLNSDMALATQEIFNAASLAQLSSEASSPLLTARGYRNFFRLVPNDEIQGRELARIAVLYLKSERIAVLHDNTGWGRPIAEIFQEEARRLGRGVVFIRGFGQLESALDFDDFVGSALGTKPDLVYFAIYWNKAHIIAHKLRYGGSHATFLGSDALKPYAFLEVPSLDKVKPYHSLAGVDIRLQASARRFLREFATRYPSLLLAPQYAAEAFDCASLLIEALMRAGSADRGAVARALREIGQYSGASGEVRFDDRGDRLNPEISLYQCEDGQRKYIGKISDLVGRASEGLKK